MKFKNFKVLACFLFISFCSLNIFGQDGSNLDKLRFENIEIVSKIDFSIPTSRTLLPKDNKICDRINSKIESLLDNINKQGFENIVFCFSKPAESAPFTEMMYQNIYLFSPFYGLLSIKDITSKEKILDKNASFKELVSLIETDPINNGFKNLYLDSSSANTYTNVELLIEGAKRNLGLMSVIESNELTYFFENLNKCNGLMSKSYINIGLSNDSIEVKIFACWPTIEENVVIIVTDDQSTLEEPDPSLIPSYYIYRLDLN